jgi:hypothetical protein
MSDLAKFVLFSGASSALLGLMRFLVSTAALPSSFVTTAAPRFIGKADVQS